MLLLNILLKYVNNNMLIITGLSFFKFEGEISKIIYLVFDHKKVPLVILSVISSNSDFASLKLFSNTI